MMQGALRNYVRSRPSLYKLWLYARFGYPNKFPGPETDLQVDGFQRSGNTFASTLVRDIFPDKSIVSHFHAVSSLKVAQRLGIPTIVVIRHPEGAIASSIVKRVSGRGMPWRRSVEYDLLGYSHYYRYVLENPEFLRICLFEEFIKNPEIIGKVAAECLNEEPPSPTDLSDAFERVMKFLASDNRPEPLQKLGNPKKQALKEDVMKKIKLMPEYARAVDTYYEVIESLVQRN